MSLIRPLLLWAAFAATLFLNGCLWLEKAEFHIRVNPDGSGSGSVRYINICDAPDSVTGSVSGAELSGAFTTLMDQYVHGDGFEQEYNQAHVTGKRLFRQDSMLCGEVTFTFDSLAAFNLFRYRDAKGGFISHLVHPLFGLYHTAVLQSNAGLTARFEGDAALVWPASVHEFDFTVVTTFDSLYPTRTFSLANVWSRSGGDTSWVR